MEEIEAVKEAVQEASEAAEKLEKEILNLQENKEKNFFLLHIHRSGCGHPVYKRRNRQRLHGWNQCLQKPQKKKQPGRCHIRLKYDFYCIQRMYFFQTSVLSAVCPDCSLLFTLSRCAFHLSARIV